MAYNPMQFAQMIRQPVATTMDMTPFINPYLAGRKLQMQENEERANAEKRAYENRMNKFIELAGLTAEGDPEKFGANVLPFAPQIGLQAMQISDQRKAMSMKSQEQEAMKGQLAVAYSELETAINQGDQNKAMIAQNKINMIKGGRPADASYMMGKQIDQGLRAQQLGQSKEQYDKDLEFKKENEAYQRYWNEIQAKRNDKQFWAKYSQDQKQFDKGLELEREKMEEAKTRAQSQELGGEVANKVAGLDDAIRQAETLKEMAKAKSGIGMTLERFTPNSQYTNMLDLFAENLGRVQSGGAIQEDEATRFIRMATWSPVGEDYETKIDRVLEMLKSKREAMATKGRSVSSAPIPQAQDSSSLGY